MLLAIRQLLSILAVAGHIAAAPACTSNWEAIGRSRDTDTSIPACRAGYRGQCSKLKPSASSARSGVSIWLLILYDFFI
ncbi:hypothetical protein V8C44DRAFT_343439 [Trichoderma aethiopicum]